MSWDFLPHVGGMGRHVAQLEAGLKAAGCEVTVFSKHDVPLTKSFGGHLAFSVAVAARIDAWVKARRIEILHVHTGPGGTLLPWHIAGVPLVVTAHHTYLQQSRVPGQAWKRILVAPERRTYRIADRVICVSDDTMRVLCDGYGVPAAKLTVIPGAFSLEPWRRADTDDGLRTRGQCVFVGRPDKRKGWDILRAAWPAILAAVPHATLVVAGFEHTAMPGVRFLGRVPDTELRPLVGTSELLLCPSRVEGFGLAAAEAIVSGTPVVACDSDGLRGVVTHDVTGVLTPVDSAAFARETVRLLGDTSTLRRMRQQCRGESERFSIQTSVRSHLALYDGVYSSHA